MASRAIEVEINGRVHQVTVDHDPTVPDRLRVAWKEKTHLVDARQIDAETFSLIDVGEGTASHEARVVETAHPGELYVHIDGAVVRVLVDGERTYVEGAGDALQGSQEIVSPMPGKVMRLLVEQEDEVVAGQGVAVVEAMKMENELVSSRAGRVKEILVSEGESVEAGKILVVIE